MARTVLVPVGVVVERKAVQSLWQDHVWRPVGVLPGPPTRSEWTELMRGEGWVRYLAGTVPLELNRTDAVGYKHNLESGHPALYVVLRRAPGEEPPVRLLLVTASPYEADAYTESGEEIVEPVAMPEALISWVAGYVAENYVEEPFRKRQRDKAKTQDHGFGRAPVLTARRRMERNRDG